MDAGDLRVFETVARLGSMGRAAETLHTVQSNVTARIRHLEEELGSALFRRHARGVSLTAAGERLLPYAAQVIRLLAEARRAAQDDGTPQGSLRIGALETTTALHLTGRLADFAAAHPAVDLTLQTGTTAELLAEVLERKLEGALVCGPVAHPELAVEPVFTEELVLLTQAPLDSLETLAGRPEVHIVVLRRGCSYRQRLEDVLTRAGVPVPRILEFGTLEAVFGCVAAGLGVTLLPRAMIGPVWPEGRVSVHPLPPRDGRVETVFVRRRDEFVSSALAAFRDALPRSDGAMERIAAE